MISSKDVPCADIDTNNSLQEKIRRLIDSLSCCYQIIGADVWGEVVPSCESFNDVMMDQLRTHVLSCNQCSATEEDVNWFIQLPIVNQEKIVERSGP